MGWMSWDAILGGVEGMGWMGCGRGRFDLIDLMDG